MACKTWTSILSNLTAKASRSQSADERNLWRFPVVVVVVGLFVLVVVVFVVVVVVVASSAAIRFVVVVVVDIVIVVVVVVVVSDAIERNRLYSRLSLFLNVIAPGHFNGRPGIVTEIEPRHGEITAKIRRQISPSALTRMRRYWYLIVA